MKTKSKACHEADAVGGNVERLDGGMWVRVVDYSDFDAEGDSDILMRVGCIFVESKTLF